MARPTHRRDDNAAETDLPVASKSGAAKRTDRHLASAAPRPGSKQALVVEMLSKKQGATLDAPVKARVLFGNGAAVVASEI